MKRYRLLRILQLVLLCALHNFAKQPTVYAKEFMRCELSKQLLHKYKMDKSLLSNWICMIEHESNRNTSMIHSKNEKEAGFGLFQLNKRDACKVGVAGGLCNKKCEDFIDEYIEDDAACARAIFNTYGFKYWNGWSIYCRNARNLPKLKVLCNI